MLCPIDGPRDILWKLVPPLVPSIHPSGEEGVGRKDGSGGRAKAHCVLGLGFRFRFRFRFRFYSRVGPDGIVRSSWLVKSSPNDDKVKRKLP